MKEGIRTKVRSPAKERGVERTRQDFNGREAPNKRAVEKRKQESERKTGVKQKREVSTARIPIGFFQLNVFLDLLVFPSMIISACLSHVHLGVTLDIFCSTAPLSCIFKYAEPLFGSSAFKINQFSWLTAWHWVCGSSIPYRFSGMDR